MEPTQELGELLKEKSELIGSLFEGHSYHAVQAIIRCMDTLPFISYGGDSNKQYIYLKELIRFGWPLLLKPYFFDKAIQSSSSLPIMTEELFDWALTNLEMVGKIELCKQIISYEKADLVKIKKVESNHFSFSYYPHYKFVEGYDRKSVDYCREKIISRIIEEKRRNNPFDREKIKTDFNPLILNPFGHFIGYNTTPEIDDYYNEEGHYQLLMMQGYDDFDTYDVFGDIEYWKYLTIIELVIGIGIKHTDACFLLKEKNPKVRMDNILTYTQPKRQAIEDYANYLDWKYSEVEQIFETITLTKENYTHFLKYPATPPPMFVEVGGDVLIRSVAGCLSNPFTLLYKELKRKYRKDYDRAVNKREERFRNELYDFFPQPNIVKIKNEIRISFKGIRTDIDAIVYDKHTGSLGLFQLKWQDPYSYSMKERFSRISNLFPKANEWISKINHWLKCNDEKRILNALQIDRNVDSKTIKINEVYLFVLSRNQMNFTGVDMDQTVAWSSWYQLIESHGTIRTLFNDPIREMYMKIKAFQPQYRAGFQSEVKFDDFAIEFDNFKFTYQESWD